MIYQSTHWDKESITQTMQIKGLLRLVWTAITTDRWSVQDQDRYLLLSLLFLLWGTIFVSNIIMHCHKTLVRTDRRLTKFELSLMAADDSMIIFIILLASRTWINTLLCRQLLFLEWSRLLYVYTLRYLVLLLEFINYNIIRIFLYFNYSVQVNNLFFTNLLKKSKNRLCNTYCNTKSTKSSCHKLTHTNTLINYVKKNYNTAPIS